MAGTAKQVRAWDKNDPCTAKEAARAMHCIEEPSPLVLKVLSACRILCVA